MKKKPAPADPQSCASCKFFLPNQNDEHGYCRRYPPVFVSDGEGGGFSDPCTAESDWCGEYLRRLNS